VRVAFVAPTIHKQGGTERCISELAEALERRGHNITVFCNAKDPLLLPNAKTYRVPTIRWPSLARYLSFLITNSLVQLVARQRGDQFDVIHSTGPDVLHPTVTTLHCCTGAVADVLALSRSGITPRPFSRLRRFVNQWSYRAISLVERYVVERGARRVIVVSEALAADVRHHDGCPNSTPLVIPNGVNLSEFQPGVHALGLRTELGLLAEEPTVIFVGYNWERKGIETLVSALALLRERDGLTAALLVVGGRGSTSYEAGVRDRLGGRVRFLGARTDMAALYGVADICVLPSEQESFGMPVLEAMACGIPTVVSRCAGVAEIIADGIDGVLLDSPLDIDELAAKLAPLLLSADVRQQLGVRARSTATRYSWDEIARRTEEVYREAVAHDPIRRGGGRG
jgi:glycosyltransferase involved in cell wall biosynthesis